MIEYKRIFDNPPFQYECLTKYEAHIDLFNRYVIIEKGDLSDGATGARDLGAPDVSRFKRLWYDIVDYFLEEDSKRCTDGWWIHDNLCENGCFADGYRVSNLMASLVLAHRLWTQGYPRSSIYWFWATFLYGFMPGCKHKAKKNGLIIVRRC